MPNITTHTTKLNEMNTNLSRLNMIKLYEKKRYEHKLKILWKAIYYIVILIIIFVANRYGLPTSVAQVLYISSSSVFLIWMGLLIIDLHKRDPNIFDEYYHLTDKSLLQETSQSKQLLNKYKQMKNEQCEQL